MQSSSHIAQDLLALIDPHFRWSAPSLECLPQKELTTPQMAEKRVTTWHDGAVRYFKWGKPGADDH